MKEKIGGVELNYYYYGGKDLYSDGNIEDMILEYCKEEKEDELLRISSEWAVLYHLALSLSVLVIAPKPEPISNISASGFISYHSITFPLSSAK